MKKFIILAVISLLSLPTFAFQDNPPTADAGIPLDVKSNKNTNTTHRAPLHLSLYAWYNQQENTVGIECPDFYEGEAMIIYNDVIIDFSNEINTTFVLPSTPGKYYLKITSENWEATGVVEI